MHRLRAVFTLGLVALGATACGTQRTSQPSPATPAPQKLALRSYRVPPGQGHALRSVLARILVKGDEAIGRAAVAPDGRLVVFAPESIHQDVEAFLKEAADTDSPPKVPPTIALTYWLVKAEPGPSPETATCGPKGMHCLRGGPKLTEAVQAIDAQIGPAVGGMHYSLVERLGVRALDSERAEVNGAASHIKQRASVAGNDILANVSLRAMLDRAPSIDTRLRFSPNQTVVLGQVALGERTPRGQSQREDPKGILLFIARGTVEP